MFHEVIQVIPCEDYRVYVYFEDGKITCFNAFPLLQKKAFEKLQDKKIFLENCTVLNHTLAWDISGERNPEEALDIDPEVLYMLNQVNEEPI